MSGPKIPPGGYRPKDRRATQKRTLLNLSSFTVLRGQTLDCLRGGRLQELKGILKNFVDNERLENLARNFDIIIRDDLSPIHSLPKLLNLLIEVMGDNFHRLFAEFSSDTQAALVEQIGSGDGGVERTTDLLFRLLLAGERRPADNKNYRAAAQLLSSETIYYFLNNYEIDRDRENQLSKVYFIKYKGVEEIEPIIGRALGDYSKCGPQATPKEVTALGAYRRIMQGFRDLSIRAYVF